MECVDSSTSYPRSGYEVESKDTSTDHAPIDKDSFQCTYFREFKREPSSGLLLSSDTCTDSDSEPDEPSIFQAIEKSSHKFLAASQQSTFHENKFKSPRSCDAPRVRFCAPVCTNPTPRKRWMQEGTGYVPVKLPRVVKRNTCLKKNCSESRQRSRTVNTYPVMPNRQASVFARVVPEKFPHPAGDAIRNYENVIEDRIVRNKRLLKSIEEVIRAMNDTRMNTESKPCIQPSNTMAKTNLIDEIIHRERSKRFRRIPNPMDEVPIQTRPFFKNPKLEKHLDQSMQKAMRKYRTCSKWGERGSRKDEWHA